MTIVFPETTKARGNTSIGVLTAYNGDGTLSLATDVNVDTSLIVSCFMYGDEWGITTNENVGQGPKPFCSKKVPQEFGDETVEVAALQYSYDPQGAAASEANRAKTLLVPGTEVWLVVRRGIDAETEPFAVGDIVDLHRVVLGKQNKTQTGAGEFDIYTITQRAVHRQSVEDVAIAA
ncbi:hypothetical protein INN71_02750 [Nocardioides sp. ChNu-153]|uniref:phage tail tube protein n=1 Tax=Nocardioides sp. ChNu-153 TaxID=2779364 RepID=UPI00264DA56D|nr:hypothetical protein [Nocardioides sp. ChNu-153]MDN7120305.1 hypothetical protein [Nocardioides sp. ChNu-153]